MLLEVSDDQRRRALAFYAAHGFVEIDRRPRYYRDGVRRASSCALALASVGWAP